MDSDRQVVVVGFPDTMSAKDLACYLERAVGLVERCRLKTTCTPYNAYPEFSCTEIEESNSWPKGSVCNPHAFVHFVSTEVAKEACKIASRGALRIGLCVLKIELSSEIDMQHKRSIVSPCYRLSRVIVEVGSLTSLNEFVVSWKGPSNGAYFELECSNKRCHFFFTLWTLFGFSRSNKKVWFKCKYKLEFFVRDIWEVHKEETFGSLTFIIQFHFPPRIYYRTEDGEVYHPTSFKVADDADPWIRTLDFTPEKSIGRCQGYRISVSPRERSQYQKILKSFSQQKLLKEEVLREVNLPHERISSHLRCDLFLLTNERKLPFDIMFLLNGIVHKGILKPASLTPQFYDLLQPLTTDTPLAIMALNHIYSYKTPVFDAEKCLKSVIKRLRLNKVALKNMDYNLSTMNVRRFIITPTKAYCYSTEVELSNRVLRGHSMLGDRFLRVSFLDENFYSLASTTLTVLMVPFARRNGPVARTTIFNRVKQILFEGFTLCGRHYQFLAFSSNQLRDHSAWFFAPSRHVNVDNIHQWMGHFPKHNVAKYAARMGQCFSSTFATVQFPLDKVKRIADVERNGYIFSDGIGKITHDLAHQCAQVLGLDHNPPSAYQIRYAGYKGVLVVWPLDKRESEGPLLMLRDSMKKFFSQHEVIEVVSWSKTLPCFLNRQIITLLSALQVENKVFIQMQDSMVEKLNAVLDDPEVAFEVLSSFCTGEVHITAMEMLLAGFHPLCEPHLRSMLQCIRASYLEELLSKARIFVKDGRWMMGCMDELAVLEYGQCFVQVSTSYPDNYFLSTLSGHQKLQRTVKVITGTIIMAKNPCLHPGDIRILEAVDHPALRHLVDCFVMPQKGDRPHSNEASGSDLDGDLYFVCWDPALVPPSGESWAPMDYQPVDIQDSRHSVQVEDVVSFFMTHMVNDDLGKICNAHVVHADQSREGALDPICLHLAELAATAVDSPKTGKSVIMPPHLKPSVYPDFMDKEDVPCYESRKILGILFRRIQVTAERAIKEDYQPGSVDMQFFDPDLIVRGFESHIPEAQSLKQLYDERLIALMDRFDVKVEAEVVSGHFTAVAQRHNSRRRGDLRERLKRSYAAIKDEFLERFRENVHVSEDEKEYFLECRASAWYHVTYHSGYIDKRENVAHDPSSYGHLLSFPWIAVETLARIKAKRRQSYESYYSIILSIGDGIHVD